MKKRMLCLLLILIWILTLASCGKKTITCDNCGKEMQVSAKANITDEWIVYCSECELALFGEEGVVSAD